MQNIFHYILYFFIYSFIGFILEVALCSISQKKLVNRGFLFGPILPIYGFGMLAVLFVTAPVRGNVWLTFLIAMLTCSVLEYLTSWLMEKLFHIKWWDYSKSDRLNLNGRICARNCLAFGIGGCFVAEYLHPHIENLASPLSSSSLVTLDIVLLVLFLVDLIASTYAVEKIKRSVKLKFIYGDQTNEIKKLASRAIAQLITRKNYLERRIERLKHDFEIRQKEFEREQERRYKELKQKFEHEQETRRKELKQKLSRLKKS